MARNFLAISLLIGLCKPSFTQNTELYSCLPDSTACVESQDQLIADICSGSFFHFHRGRVSWPPLRAVGSTTVSIQTYGADNLLPLYLEIVPVADSVTCLPMQNGHVILETRSLAQCGGLWETVGPIEITRFTPIGSFYRVQLVFLEGYPPSSFGLRSPGLGCIRVTAKPTSMHAHSWGAVKLLYQ